MCEPSQRTGLINVEYLASQPNILFVEMTNESRTVRAGKFAEILKALAHSSRLLMVEEINHGERCVQDLQKLVGSDITTVSIHLNVLKRAGIVKSRRQGQQIFYSLEIPCVLNLFTCLSNVGAARQHKAKSPSKSL